MALKRQHRARGGRLPAKGGRLALLAVLLLLLLGAPRLPELAESLGLGLTAGSRGSGETVRAMVERVVDGDTVIVRLGGRRERLRYIGIDAPESARPGYPVECYGKEASEANAALVAGREVRLEFDAQRRDDYDRLLAYVYLDDGTMVNAALVAEGYATTLTIPPNTKHASTLRALEREARAERRGLWGACR